MEAASREDSLRFGWDQVAEAYNRLYEELAAG